MNLIVFGIVAVFISALITFGYLLLERELLDQSYFVWSPHPLVVFSCVLSLFVVGRIILTQK